MKPFSVHRRRALLLLGVVGLAELVLGLFFGEHLTLHPDERSLSYRWDAEIGWVPVASSQGTFRGTRSFDLNHNSRGFRDSEHVPDDRPGLLVLGDSFVWGYDVEQSERFTDRLQRAAPAWSIYNLGVSGYGTDQALLLLRRHFAYYQPQVVLLVITHNDRWDNSWNVRYGGYYKPFFIEQDGNLKLRGVPVPRSENYVLAGHDLLARSALVRLAARAQRKLTAPAALKRLDPTFAILGSMQQFVAEGGATLVIGLETDDPELEAFLTETGIPHVDLTELPVYPSHGKHWTPESHALVSERLHSFLKDGGYLDR